MLLARKIMLVSFLAAGCFQGSFMRMVRGFSPALVARQRPGRSFVQQHRVRKVSRAVALSPGTAATSFDDGQRPFQITTPIYYVNDKPHIGHAYTSVGTCLLSSYCDVTDHLDQTHGHVCS